MIRRVLYISNTKAHMSDADVGRLYQVASANAARDGLTGLTCYHNKSMFHLREGEPQLVSNSIVRAESQGWCYNLSIVEDAMFEDRLFDDWYLGYAPQDRASLDQGEKLLDLEGIKTLPLMQTALQNLTFSAFFDIFADDLDVNTAPQYSDMPLEVHSTQSFIDAISATAAPQL